MKGSPSSFARPPAMLIGAPPRPGLCRRPRDGADVRQPPVVLGVVEAVSDDEPLPRRLLQREGGPVDLHVDLALARLVDQGATLQAPRPALADVVEQEVQRDPGVDDVVEQQDVPVLVGDLRRVDDVGPRRARRPFAQRRDAQEVAGHVQGDGAHEVGHEDHAALHEADDADLLARRSPAPTSLPISRMRAAICSGVKRTAGLSISAASPQECSSRRTNRGSAVVRAVDALPGHPEDAAGRRPPAGSAPARPAGTRWSMQEPLEAHVAARRAHAIARAARPHPRGSSGRRDHVRGGARRAPGRARRAPRRRLPSGSATRPGRSAGIENGAAARTAPRPIAHLVEVEDGLAPARQGEAAAGGGLASRPGPRSRPRGSRPTPRRPPAPRERAAHGRGGPLRAARPQAARSAPPRPCQRRSRRVAASRPGRPPRRPASAADRASASRTAGLKRRSRYGSQLVAHPIAQDGHGRRWSGPRARSSDLPARWSSTSLARQPRAWAAAGRPRAGRMAESPRRPEPRSRRRSTVSAWSSRVWASAMAHAPSSRLDRAQERVALATRRLLEAAAFGARGRATSALPRRGAERPGARRGRAQKAASAAESGAQAVVEMRGHDRRSRGAAPRAARASRRATESAPPERPTTTARPRTAMPEPPQGLARRRSPDAVRLTGTASSLRGEKWWRCRDLNPGRRGYEPRALTN